MKKVFIVLITLGVMAAAVGCILGLNAHTLLKTPFRGSGIIVTKTIPAPGFDAIDVSRAIKVIISDKIDQIRIDADDNIIDYVVVRAEGGELEISLDNTLNIHNHNITVTVPANGKIRSLEASSASSIRSEVPLKADKFELDASSAAKIEVAVNAHTCEIDTSSASTITANVTTNLCRVESSSASKVELSGTTDRLEAELSSASKLAARALIAADCTATTSSGSSATVNCQKTLTARASSGSSIRYTGNCQANTHSSSGGGVRKF